MKDEIEKILVKYDPVKLIKMGAPSDEYDSESRLIWERTTRHFSLDRIHNIIYDVFYFQFGTGTVYKAIGDNDEMVAVGEDSAPRDVTVRIIGKFESYLPIATEIKELLDQEKTRAT